MLFDVSLHPSIFGRGHQPSLTPAGFLPPHQQHCRLGLSPLSSGEDCRCNSPHTDPPQHLTSEVLLVQPVPLDILCAYPSGVTKGNYILVCHQLRLRRALCEIPDGGFHDWIFS